MTTTGYRWISPFSRDGGPSPPYKAKATLGDLLKRNPGLLPSPLDQMVEKAWGYASERGRHLREGREPKPEEVELIVGLASIVATYLSKKLK